MDLNQAKVIVTGGSSGIGKSTAQLLKEAGAEVLITGRNADKLARVADELGVKGLAFDIAETDQLEAKAKEAVALLGGVNVLINNAGIGEFAKLGGITLDMFHRVYTTNIFGLTMFTQSLLPELKAAKGGNIINIASTAGVKGFAFGSVYSSSKFALRGLTQCWQAELRRDDIRVVLVNPSEVTTAFAQENREERENQPKKLRPIEIAHTIKSVLEMDDRGFIPEVTVFATNPWEE